MVGREKRGWWAGCRWTRRLGVVELVDVQVGKVLDALIGRRAVGRV